MPTDFNDLAYFGITNVQMNGKCWNRGVTFSSRTIFHFEQCGMFSADIRWIFSTTKLELHYKVTGFAELRHQK